MINRQKLAAPLLTKYSIVNPMAPPTTALESRSYPTLRQSTVSQAVPTVVPAPVTCQGARPPDLAPLGTVQTSQSAVCAPTHILHNPLGAGYARITTQTATKADPTEADKLGTSDNAANARTVSAQTALQPRAPRADARPAHWRTARALDAHSAHVRAARVKRAQPAHPRAERACCAPGACDARDNPETNPECTIFRPS